MTDSLLSVGIDIGTSTTQLIFSRLTVSNQANSFSVPRMAITSREVIFRSEVSFTPLLSDTVIDAAGVEQLVAKAYQSAGISPKTVSTGAVIITGETARKENAREVLSALSGYAGDFVVATAGPDLESILAARGAGADRYAREHHAPVLHCDIGGGTSNLALFDREGELVRTGCLDVGGRLIKVDRNRVVTYVSPVFQRAGQCPAPAVGQQVTPETLASVIHTMVEALAQAAGLLPGRDKLDAFFTKGTHWEPTSAPYVSFSGGVADCIFSPPEDPFAYGDIGVLLGKAIRDTFPAASILRGRETIRATVVGAGSHATELSGSTIFYRDVPFPLKNLPILKLTAQEEESSPEALADCIQEKLSWFRDESGLVPTALALRGLSAPSYDDIQRLAQGVVQGLFPLRERGFIPVIALEYDQAKVLGQAMYALAPGPLLCLDGVRVDNGDYIDIGAPVAGGTVLPVVIKTLVFSQRDKEE